MGIIGSGFGLYGLLPAFNTTPGCLVTSVCGRKTKRLENYCKSIGLKTIYTNWRKMLDNEDLDAVAIAVVPDIQYEIAKYAIKKGLHVFAEKPLAATLRQARELLILAQKSKIIHMIDFEFPEIDKWVKVKQLLDKESYGELRQICTNWDFVSYDIKNKKSSWKTDVLRGGGALSYYFSHSLNYLEHFAGRLIDFHGVLSYSKESLNGGEVGVGLILKFENNITGYAHLSCNTKGLNRHKLMFICEKATITLENEGSITSNFKITVYQEGETKQILVPMTGDTKTGEDERVKVVKKLGQRFINAIIKKEKASPSFKEGVRVQELIEKIREGSDV